MEGLLFERFDLSENHPWGEQVRQMILGDVYGLSMDRIEGYGWGGEALTYLGLDSYPADSYSHWALYDSHNLLVAAGLNSREIDSQTPTVKIDYLVTNPTFRKKGYGREMLRRLDDAASQLGAQAIELYCAPALRPFYISANYQVTKTKLLRKVL